jgi:lysophospholipase L1-like esterase
MSKTSKPTNAPVIGKRYTFTNCDTGRNLSAGAVSLFTLEEDGRLRSGNRFLCADGSLSDEGQAVRIIPLKNGRYHLIVDGQYLADSDEGYAPVAAPILRETDTIGSCWFMTEQGSAEPMRIMLLGDSITHGSCCDDPTVDGIGCRKKLSEALAENADSRFVFVGSVRQFDTQADETALYRHEGHGGWFADDIFCKNPESRGLIDRLDAWMGKYRPDVVLAQVGTNDCAFTMSRYGRGEEPWTPIEMEQLLVRFEQFTEKIWTLLPQNGTLILATVPPTIRTECLNDWFVEFNRHLPALVEKWKKQGRNTVLSDNNAAIAACPDKGNCSDKIHLSPIGYAAMADSYTKAFYELFPGTIGR